MNKLSKNSKWINLLLVLATFSTMFCFVMFRWTILYETPDDQYIMSILSGRLLGHPDAHVVYIKYPFAILISSLYMMFPAYDWYATIMVMLQIGTISVMLYYFLKQLKKNSSKVIFTVAYYCAFFLCWTNELLSFTYTTTAAMTGGTLVVVYELCERRIRDCGVMALLAFATLGLRNAVFFMIVPICGIYWLSKMKKQKYARKFHIGVVVLMLVVVVTSYAIDYCAYNSAEWKNYATYNEARTKLYDYNEKIFSDYNDYKKYYDEVGLTENDSKIYLSKNLALCDEKLFSMVPELANSLESKSFMSRVKNAVSLIIKSGFMKNKVMLLVSFVLWALLIVKLVYEKKIKEIKREITFLAVFGILWFYLGYQGRIIPRVAHSMLLLQIIVATIELMKSKFCINIKQNTKKIFGIAFVCAVLMVCFYDVRMIKHMNDTNKDKISNDAYKKIVTYCNAHPSAVFFGDVSSIAVCSYEYQFKADNQCCNYIILGDWYANSLLYTEKIKQKGIDSIKNRIVEKDAYLVVRKDLVEDIDYLSDIYRKDIQLKETDEIDVSGNPYGVYELVY